MEKLFKNLKNFKEVLTVTEIENVNEYKNPYDARIYLETLAGAFSACAMDIENRNDLKVGDKVTVDFYSNSYGDFIEKITKFSPITKFSSKN